MDPGSDVIEAYIFNEIDDDQPLSGVSEHRIQEIIRGQMLFDIEVNS